MEETLEKQAASIDDLSYKGLMAARKYLECKGYEIIEVNWSCKFGSVDIIAFDPEVCMTCFIDVETRSSIEAGMPEEDDGKEVRAMWERIAMAFMLENDDWENGQGVRFDKIGICAAGGSRALLRHHQGWINSGL